MGDRVDPIGNDLVCWLENKGAHAHAGMWNLEMGRPNTLLTIKQQVDINPACFPPKLPLTPEIRFDLLDGLPDFPNGPIGFDGRNCV